MIKSNRTKKKNNSRSAFIVRGKAFPVTNCRSETVSSERYNSRLRGVNTEFIKTKHVLHRKKQNEELRDICSPLTRKT